jgi:hypothetical protein
MNPEAVFDASKEVGLVLNARETMCILTSHSYNMKTDNGSFENVAKFKYSRMALTNQTCINQETESRLNSVNACCPENENVLSSCHYLIIRRLKYIKFEIFL